jgi:hypothetical protein
MSNSSDKVFIGQGRKFTTQYGENFEIELSVSDMKRAIETARARGYSKTFTRKDRDTGAPIEEEVVKITLWEKREWATHYGELKNANREGGNASGNGAAASYDEKPAAVVNAAPVDDDDLPF